MDFQQICPSEVLFAGRSHFLGPASALPCHSKLSSPTHLSLALALALALTLAHVASIRACLAADLKAGRADLLCAPKWADSTEAALPNFALRKLNHCRSNWGASQTLTVWWVSLSVLEPDSGSSTECFLIEQLTAPATYLYEQRSGASEIDLMVSCCGEMTLQVVPWHPFQGPITGFCLTGLALGPHLKSRMSGPNLRMLTLVHPAVPAYYT